MSNIEKRRVNALLQIVLDGAQPHDVREYVAEKEAAGEEPWTIGEGQSALKPAQINRLMKAVDDRLVEACPGDSVDLARHKCMLRNLYSRAVQAGDVRTARSILTDLAKLDGLNRRKPQARVVPAEVRTATDKLRATIKRKKDSNAQRQTDETD